MRRAMGHATHKAARASGGRPIPAGNLHVTLAFLGSVPERRLPELAEVGRGAAILHAGDAVSPSKDGPPLELVFDRLDCWRAAQLLCALPAEPPSPVAALARGLQGLLTAHGFTPDLKPFRPHVTVARKVSRPGRIASMHPVVWRITELALIESRTLPEGALYSVVESYPLRSSAEAPGSAQ
jgi:RNA 2',3'-cyclic 3'-phosphodiesterase